MNKISNFFLKLLFVFKKIKNKLFFYFSKKDKKNNFKNSINLDKKLLHSLSKSRFPNLKQLKYIGRYLSPKELFLIRLSLIVILVSFLSMGGHFYYVHLKLVPLEGRIYSEAVIGSPYNINPLYAQVNDIDSDLSSLIYSSLFKRGKNGELLNDLVDHYIISKDNKNYTLNLKKGVKWHDGKELNADDVLFTFNLIIDKKYKSPLGPSFQGVQIEKQDDYTLKFILEEPYAVFLDLLTFGILPADIWSAYSPETIQLSELNLKPIGSGPYKFKELVKKKKTGHISEYRLEINKDYYNSLPYLNITFKFFPDFENAILALNNGAVDGISYLPKEYKKDIMTPKAFNFHDLLLPQITLAFFNEEANPALGDKALRQALSYGLDKNTLVNDVLGGKAYVVDSPILASSFAYDSQIKKYDYNKEKAEKLLDTIDWKLEKISLEQIDKAKEELEKIGDDENEKKEKLKAIIELGEGKWRKKDENYLIFNLYSVKRPENDQALEYFKKNWEALGIKIITHSLPAVKLQQEVIRPRKFDILFYGQVLGSDPDPYVFWHSSEAKEGGFNIANFKNKEVDKMLEDARLTTDKNIRKKKYKEFQKIISEEEPVIFIYSPIYTYMQSKKLKDFDVHLIFSPSDRFNNISDWYMETGKKLVW